MRDELQFIGLRHTGVQRDAQGGLASVFKLIGKAHHDGIARDAFNFACVVGAGTVRKREGVARVHAQGAGDVAAVFTVYDGRAYGRGFVKLHGRCKKSRHIGSPYGTTYTRGFVFSMIPRLGRKAQGVKHLKMRTFSKAVIA